MNFKKIFEMQKKLDKSIEESHGVKSDEIINKKILALLVELGEFANEYAPFKYWKKNKVVNIDNVIEEFVDGIHFFISLGAKLNIPTDIKSNIASNDESDQLLATFEAIGKLSVEFNQENLVHAFGLYMGNARLLNISNEDIEKHYLQKNKINYERIANNY